MGFIELTYPFKRRNILPAAGEGSSAGLVIGAEQTQVKHTFTLATARHHTGFPHRHEHR